MSDGSTADITFCEDHLDGDFEEIWKIVKERFLWEEETRGLLTLDQATPEIREMYTKQNRQHPIVPKRSAVQQHEVDKELDRIFALQIEKKVGSRMWKYIDGA